MSGSRKSAVNNLLSIEFSALLAQRQDALSGVLSKRGANDRVDALTLLCREMLRSSSLCHIAGVLCCYGGTHYVPAPPKDVVAALANVLVDGGVSPLDVRRMGDMPLSVLAEKSHPGQPLLSFPNGVLDCSDMSFRPHSPQLLSTEYLPYPYTPGAECPIWGRFLSEVLPDADVRAVLQEFLGVCYLDRKALSVEKFGIFLGEGANGKSVIRDVLTAAMGEGNVASYDAEQLTRTELQPYLIGKRINFASDMKVSAAFDSALKALASGQDVVGRKIYGEPVTVNCPPIIFSMNALPPFRDCSPAFFRRVLLFEFGVTIPEGRRDASLAARICHSELPGVFAWMMEGRTRMLASGGRFSPCPTMEKAVDALRRRVGGDVRYPAKEWLERSGYSLHPTYEGQPPCEVSQKEIADALGAVSPTAITRELRSYGVQTRRSKELFYKVYKK